MSVRRSVPPQYVRAIIAAIFVCIVFGTWGAHANGDEHSHYGSPYPALITHADAPQKSSCTLGFGCISHTAVEVAVQAPDQSTTQYYDIELGGRKKAGQTVNVWFYDGNEDDIAFANIYSDGSVHAAPWYSMAEVWVSSIGLGVAAAALLIIGSWFGECCSPALSRPTVLARS